MRGLVINLGLPRTGTSSVRAAMRQLGYKVQDDPFAPWRVQLLLRDPRPLVERVGDMLDADFAAGYEFLSEPYNFVPDEVIGVVRPDLHLYGRELLSRGSIPMDATVFATRREAASWVASVVDRLPPRAFRPGVELAGSSRLLGLYARWAGHAVDAPGFPTRGDLLELHAAHEDRTVNLPNLHTTEGDGWMALAELLDLEAIPWPTPFPHENRRTQ